MKAKFKDATGIEIILDSEDVKDVFDDPMAEADGFCMSVVALHSDPAGRLVYGSAKAVRAKLGL